MRGPVTKHNMRGPIIIAVVKGSGRSGADGKGAGGRRNNGRNQGYGGKGGGQHAGEVVVHVDNLPASANWKGLKDLFAPFGVLFSAVSGRNGRVHFSNTAQAEAAIANMNGAEWEGTAMQVYYP